jgi:hypothetical protein
VCRCDERLKAKTEGSTRLTHSRLHGGLEPLKIKTRLIDKHEVNKRDVCVGMYDTLLQSDTL